MSSIVNGIFVYQFGHLIHHNDNAIVHGRTNIFVAMAVIVVAEHGFLLFRLVVNTILDSIPTWADKEVRAQEYHMKSFWLNRLIGEEQDVTTESSEGKMRSMTST